MVLNHSHCELQTKLLTIIIIIFFQLENDQISFDFWLNFTCASSLNLLYIVELYSFVMVLKM